LDKSEFERALKIGLGRALLYVKEHPNVPCRDIILDVCLHTSVYDGQIEGSREVYLYEVLQSTNDYAWYRQRILAAFSGPPGLEGSDYSHLFALVLYMAKRGDQEARDRIYARVRDDATDAWDYVGDMLSLDGLRGLQFIVRLQSIPSDDWEFDRIAATLIEDFPEQANEETLRALLPDHPDFLTPLLVVLRDRSDPSFEQRREARSQARKAERSAELAISYADFKKRLDEGTDKRVRSRFGIARPWGIHANDEDIQLAALDLEAEQDQFKLSVLLGIFSKRRYPLEPDYLLAIASQYLPMIEQSTDSGRPTIEASLAVGALNALTNVSHPKVRAFAMTLLDRPDLLHRAVDMLTENFEEGDWQLITSLTELHHIAQEDYHSLGIGVRTAFEHHPHPDAIPALLNLYEYSPCSHCRHHIVENLHSLHALPDWMIREAAHDSYSDTREFIEKEFPGKQGRATG
jgi:hypothetical protein